MPSRILREGINSSPRINSLSPGAELFYRRLMSVVDDYGRFYASPATLRGACWPTCPERVTEKDVEGWLGECSRVETNLVMVYSSKGCRYLEVVDFNQPQRSRAKFPQPENNLQADCAQNDFSLRSSDFVVRSSDFVEILPTPQAAPVDDPPKPPRQPSPNEILLAKVAQDIQVRHPQNRGCGISQVTASLKAIAAKLPVAARAQKLHDIDRNHGEWCKSEAWTKDGGEFAKGLENWLAPTKGRFDTRPQHKAPRNEPEYQTPAQRRAFLEASGPGGVQ